MKNKISPQIRMITILPKINLSKTVSSPSTVASLCVGTITTKKINKDKANVKKIRNICPVEI